MTTPTIAEIDPHGFYSVSAAARVLRINRTTLYGKLDGVVRDAWGRIPGREVLRLAGIDWRVEVARQPRGDVRKELRKLV